MSNLVIITTAYALAKYGCARDPKNQMSVKKRLQGTPTYCCIIVFRNQ